MPDGKRAVASGAAASSAARGERAEGVLAAEAGRRGDGRGTAETWRAPCWDGTLAESGGTRATVVCLRGVLGAARGQTSSAA